MLAATYSVAADQKLRPKSGRKPLQPKNFQANSTVDFAKAKPKKECVEVSPSPICNNNNNNNNGELKKEKNKVLVAASAKIGSFDASLAEELSAMRKRLERLRMDREKTEKMLEEKDAILDFQMKELENRGEIQKKLEIEVDRLYRLNQLHSQSMNFSPIRSLRERLSCGKKAVESEDREESVGESVLPELTSSVSPQLIEENK